ncbi:hypothetical protein LPJ67_002124 [Coemansia sp. RSA 1938]|nr:hypothetical protein LPJ67_002124 [Coemansia sp. RSA 1938]
MAFNRFRIYDKVQRTITTSLLGVTVLGTLFISANVYMNWAEKKRLRLEASLEAKYQNDRSV